VDLLAGDFDGDGKDDVLVYDNGSDSWTIGVMASGALHWTIVASTPNLGRLDYQNSLITKGDFDGDRAEEVMVYRFADQTWHLGDLFSQRTMVFAQVGSTPGFDPEDLVLAVGRTLYQNRDAIGFHNTDLDSYRVISLENGSIVATPLLDIVRVGDGCPTAAGLLPRQWVKQQPTAGGNFTITLDDTPPWSLAYHVLGLSDTQYAGSPLPLSLGAFGGPPSCYLRASIEVSRIRFTDAEGHFASSFVMPSVFLGRDLYSQFLVLDAGNPYGLQLVVSDALKFRVYR
jgi:hypothetical protein